MRFAAQLGSIGRAIVGFDWLDLEMEDHLEGHPAARLMVEEGEDHLLPKGAILLDLALVALLA
jgi:hypothetical protein